MSVYYDAREHMVISDAEENCDYVGILRGHLALMGALMLCGEVRYCDLALTADQHTYKFSGTQVNKDLHAVVDALEDAKCIDWNAAWGYRWSAGGGIATLAGAQEMCSHFEEIEKYEEIPKEVFYSCYVDADCGEGVGSAYAYGVWNGKRYHGDIAFTPIERLPEAGEWRYPQTAVIYDVYQTESVDRKRVIEIAEELSTLSQMDDISYDDESISVFINNLVLHGKKDIEKYTALCGELNTVTNGECFIADELEDFGSLDPRILKMELQEDNSWKFQIAEV